VVNIGSSARGRGVARGREEARQLLQELLHAGVGVLVAHFEQALEWVDGEIWYSGVCWRMLTYPGVC
jgi:hypothetical protein